MFRYWVLVVGWSVEDRYACLVGVRLRDTVADPQGITAPILIRSNDRNNLSLHISVGSNGFKDTVGLIVGEVRCDLEAAQDKHVQEGEEEVQSGDSREGHARVLEVKNAMSVHMRRGVGANGQRIGGNNGKG